MALEPIKVSLTPAEIKELLKRTINDTQKKIDEVERKLRELNREDTELNILSNYVGAEYVNPDGRSNAAEIAELEQERGTLYHIMETANSKLSELNGVVGGSAPAAPGSAPAPGAAPNTNPDRNMWQ